MQYQILPVTPFQQNCTLLWCENTHKSAIVDPGGDIQQITETLIAKELIPERILLTHGHIDHAGGAATLAKKLNLPIEGPHPDDGFLLDALFEQARMFGFPETELQLCEPDRWLQPGETVHFGEEALEVYHCPGHTPGHIVFFHRSARLALVGDVLFRGSIGRTDFPRGNHAQLIHSIREQLWPLGDDVRFIPGHGPESTFGEERRNNPFVADGV
ncbi:MAG: MBL fold metallo-hydrolase [Gammaproteobacteria bacterium]|nr:MBL fold metallo-hydrolase [Gammaproteobacteria bacterium]